MYLCKHYGKTYKSFNWQGVSRLCDDYNRDGFLLHRVDRVLIAQQHHYWRRGWCDEYIILGHWHSCPAQLFRYQCGPVAHCLENTRFEILRKNHFRSIRAYCGCGYLH